MEAQCGCELIDYRNLTYFGDGQATCDGCDDLFETHLNLQGTVKSGAAAEQKKNQHELEAPNS